MGNNNSRYRGTAIILTDRGILIGKEINDHLKRYALPGGQCDSINGRRESRKDAAIRELGEETGLEAIIAKEIGEEITRDSNGIQTNHKIYLIKAKGTLNMITKYTAKPNPKCNELENLGFFDINKINNPKPQEYQGHVYACLKKYLNECKSKKIDWRQYKSEINFD